MKVQIDNIEFDFSFAQYYVEPNQDENPLFNLSIFLRPNLIKRFIRECGYVEGCLPHYDEGQMEFVKEDMRIGSGHSCSDPDTEIVLMNWLFDKKRKYKFEFTSLDPFWLFHDSFHARNDVWNYQVNQINSYVEMQRLLQGAEFAKSKGFPVLPHTLFELERNWQGRWSDERLGATPFNFSEMYRFLDDDGKEEYDGFPEEFGPSQYYYDILHIS